MCVFVPAHKSRGVLFKWCFCNPCSARNRYRTKCVITAFLRGTTVMKSHAVYAYWRGVSGAHFGNRICCGPAIDVTLELCAAQLLFHPRSATSRLGELTGSGVLFSRRVQCCCYRWAIPTKSTLHFEVIRKANFQQQHSLIWTNLSGSD